MGKIRGKISVVMPEELEKKLRIRAMEKFGLGRGSLSQAVEEAVRLWLKEKTAAAEGKKKT
jgi:Arc/MetJ-type ribon-helix-helix transcriptional regulator